ncbi:PaaI family thioesterase [Rurimicrobium arvi]
MQTDIGLPCAEIQESPMDLKEYIGKTISGSPSEAGNWLQFKLEEFTPGNATISLIVRPEMTNPYKHIHGGMMALVIDESIGWAVLSLSSEQNYTTLNLSIDFLYAIPDGKRLWAKSHVVRAGKKIVNVECSVFDEENRILAKASSNLVSTGMKKSVADKPSS